MIKPKELFFRGRPANLSEFQLHEPDYSLIVACPHPPQEAVKAGRAIAVPSGEFSVDRVLKKLPSDYQPDIVNISARNVNFKPIGLHRFGCPTVMKIGDTFHWGDGSLSGIVKYCQQLQCDYHWVYQGVQHLHFFVEAGLKNVFWLPGTMAIDPYIPPPANEKKIEVVFRGSRSEFHVQRSRLISFLEKSGVEIDIARKPYKQSLEDYPKSKIALNCSLNGDLNRRVFEVLMAGGFLLTDRLSPQAGLSQLFQEGIHLECYGDDQELLGKITYYLKNPQIAEQIAVAGHRQLLEYFSQGEIQKKFYRYILNPEENSPFSLNHDLRASGNLPSNSNSLYTRMKLYEVIQELHRINPKISLIYWSGNCKELLADLADLPRLTVTYAGHDFLNMKAYCTQLGVADQIQFCEPSLNQLKKETYQVVLVDPPVSGSKVSDWLKGVLPLVSQSDLLLLTCRPKRVLYRQINSLLKDKGMKSIRIGFPNQTWEPQEVNYLAYQKVMRPTHLDCSVPNLIVNPMPLKSHLLQQVKSLHISRAGRYIYLRNQK